MDLILVGAIILGPRLAVIAYVLGAVISLRLVMPTIVRAKQPASSWFLVVLALPLVSYVVVRSTVR